MRYFKKVLYVDGGPNDRGTVVAYKVISNDMKAPVSKNGFEQWHEISFKEYNDSYKAAKKQYQMFQDAFKK